MAARAVKAARARNVRPGIEHGQNRSSPAEPMLQCPHCFRTVIPSLEGICPVCQKDTGNLEGVDRDVELRTVYEDSKNPHKCCSCAGSTRRKVRLKRSLDLSSGGTSEESSLSAPMVATIVFGALFGLIIPIGTIGRMFAPGRSGGHSGKVTVRVTVTQCPFCYRENPIEPVRVDYDHCYIQVPLRREYAEEFRALNPA